MFDSPSGANAIACHELPVVPNMRRGLNLFEVIFIFGGAFAVLIGVRLFADGGSWLCTIGAGALGCVSCLILFFAAIAGIERAFVRRPASPHCRNGCCVQQNYKRNKVWIFHDWTCHCGDTYRERCGRFMLVENGNARPYLRWTFFRGWRPDRRKCTSAGN